MRSVEPIRPARRGVRVATQDFARQPVFVTNVATNIKITSQVACRDELVDADQASMLIPSLRRTAKYGSLTE